MQHLTAFISSLRRRKMAPVWPLGLIDCRTLRLNVKIANLLRWVAKHTGSPRGGLQHAVEWPLGVAGWNTAHVVDRRESGRPRSQALLGSMVWRAGSRPPRILRELQEVARIHDRRRSRKKKRKILIVWMLVILPCLIKSWLNDNWRSWWKSSWRNSRPVSFWATRCSTTTVRFWRFAPKRERRTTGSSKSAWIGSFLVERSNWLFAVDHLLSSIAFKTVQPVPTHASRRP